MSEADSRSLPAEVMEKTKQHILDTLAAMISGSELPPGRTALQFARAYGAGKLQLLLPRISRAVPSKPRLPMACWPR